MSKSIDEKIIKQFKWFFKKGYITHRDGNVAYRLPGGYSVTASGVDKNDLKRTDFVIVNGKGRRLECYDAKRPSIEIGAHVAILEQSKKNFSVHVHSPNAVALAALFEIPGKFGPTSYNLMQVLNTQYPELFRYTDVGLVVPFLDPGSVKLHESIVNSMIRDLWDIKEAEFIQNVSDICILQRHGVFAIGDSLEECVEHIVRLEHISTILLKIISASGNIESIL